MISSNNVITGIKQLKYSKMSHQQSLHKSKTNIDSATQIDQYYYS